MALAARQVQVAARDDHAIAVERKVIVDKDLGIAAEVENVHVAVKMEDGRIGVARQQKIRGIAVAGGAGGANSQAPHAVAFTHQGGTFQKFSGLGQIKEAKEESSNKGSLSIKLLEILCGSGVCLLFTLIFAALPIAAIVIGSVYLPQCEFINGSSNTNIPIWLIVFGAASLLQTMVNICKRCCKCIAKSSSDDDDGDDASKCISRCGCCIESFFIAFLVVWVIAGSVWVFSAFNDYQLFGSLCEECCHPVPYVFSFVVLILIYSVGGLFCIGYCCCLCCYAMCSD